MAMYLEANFGENSNEYESEQPRIVFIALDDVEDLHLLQIIRKLNISYKRVNPKFRKSDQGNGWKASGGDFWNDEKNTVFEEKIFWVFFWPFLGFFAFFT
jgi:hypothetical protein